MSDFVPKTEMERMFVQTVGWDALRLWRRLTFNIERGNWSHAAVMTLGLTFIYLQKSVSPSFSAARRADLERDAQRNMEYLEEGVFDKLSIEEQHSLFRVSQFVLATLCETEASYLEGPVALILTLMHKVYFREDAPKLMHLEQALLLQKLYRSDDWSEKFRWKKSPPDLRTTTHEPLQLPPVEDLERFAWRGKEQTDRAPKDSLPFVPEAGREFISELGIYVEVFGDKFVFQTDARFSHHETWRLKIVKIHEGEASQAGWRAGDVILSINSFPVSSVDDLRMSYSNLLPGEQVVVKIKRDTEIKSYRISLKGTPTTKRHHVADARSKKELVLAGHEDRFVELNEKLQTSTTEYGIKSKEATHDLITLAHFVDRTQLFDVNVYLYELVGILEDKSINVTPFDLRRVYALSRSILSDSRNLLLSEKLQSEVFARRLSDFGHDMGLAIPLTRLVKIWHATGKLQEGSAVCQTLLNWAKKFLTSDDLMYRQFESVASFVASNQQTKDFDVETIHLPTTPASTYDETETTTTVSSTTPSSILQDVEGNLELVSAHAEHGSAHSTVVDETDLWRETDEFVATLSLVALDHYHCGRADEAVLVLQELLAYYSECSGEDARRVGEMLWTLMETSLRDIIPFREKLIRQSMKMAFDGFLRKRFYAHVRRLLYLIKDKFEVDRTLEFILTECKAVSPSLSSFIYERNLHLGVKERKRYVHSGSNEKEVRDAEQEYLRRLSGDQPLARARLQFANDLGEQLSEYYAANREVGKGIGILRELLAQANQSKDDLTKLLARLAHLHILNFNVFEATAMLSMAFNIADTDYDPESEPPIAEISA